MVELDGLQLRHGQDRGPLCPRRQPDLGHVFPDGPKDRAEPRHRINSAALRFIPVADLEQEGYGEYRKLFETDRRERVMTARTETAILAGGGLLPGRPGSRPQAARRDLHAGRLHRR